MKKMNNLQTKDLVAEALRNEILSGGIEAGEELKQEVLAEMLGVSRMPVREALQMLEQEGFIERLPNRHMVVAEQSADKISGIMKILAAMETEIVIQGTGADDESAQVQLQAMAKALTREDYETAVEYELEYHHALVHILQITYLEQLFTKALDGYVSYIIKRETGSVSARYERLMKLNEARQQANSELVSRTVSSYYQQLADSWSRKEIG